MNWAFDLLGLPMDADVASVKRAYARLLRTTRPDEDAEAFQHLHTAYKLALEHANGREAHASAPTVPPTSTNSTAKTTLHTQQQSSQRPTSAPVGHYLASPLALASQVIRQALDTQDERMFANWLSALPEFWSLRTKQETGHLMLQQLMRTPQPIPPTILDVVLEFFDLQRVMSGVNPLALAQLRQRQQAMWHVLPENHRTLALRLSGPTARPPDVSDVRACLHVLDGPPRWPRMIWTAINRGRVTKIARLIQYLCGGQFERLPDQIDRRQAEFWYRAVLLAEHSWPRFIVGFARAACFGLVMGVCVAMAVALSSVPENDVIDWTNAFGVGAATAGGTLLLWLAYAAWAWLDQWQRQPEFMASRHAWLRRLLIPALCGFGVAADYLMGSPLLAAAIVVLAVELMLRRFFNRRPAGTRNSPRSYAGLVASLPAVSLLLFFVAKVADAASPGFFDRIPWIAILASAMLGLWFADMWRNRIYVRSRTAP